MRKIIYIIRLLLPILLIAGLYVDINIAINLAIIWFVSPLLAILIDIRSHLGKKIFVLIINPFSWSILTYVAIKVYKESILPWWVWLMFGCVQVLLYGVVIMENPYSKKIGGRD